MPTETTIEQPPTNQLERKPTYDVGQEFIESGGEVLEWDKDGRPKRWKRGYKDKKFIDPKGIEEKDITTYLNQDGKWEATTESKVEEAALWVDEFK